MSALGNYATTSCLTFSNITGKPTTLSGYGITDGYSTSNPSGYITAGANSFTGAQNLQDNELIRAKLRDYSETVSSPTISAGTLVLNLETSNIFTVSLNAAITTLTISNPPASGSGGSFTLVIDESAWSVLSTDTQLDINAANPVGFSGNITVAIPASGSTPAQDLIIFLLFLVRSDGVTN